MPTAEQIMAKMRGTAEREQSEPKGDATTQALLRQARGDTDYSHIHETNRQAEAEYERTVRKRAQELRQRGVVHPESTARMELHMESQSRKEQEERRAVYEAMTAGNRAEMEANSTAALRERVKATATGGERRLSKFEESILALLRTKTSAA